MAEMNLGLSIDLERRYQVYNPLESRKLFYGVIQRGRSYKFDDCGVVLYSDRDFIYFSGRVIL